MSNPTHSPFAQAFQLGIGFAHTQALHTFIQLGIPMFLKAETKSVDAIARHCEANPDALYRFLRFLSKIGVVELEGQQCQLSSMGQLLRADMPGNLTKGLGLMVQEPWQLSWKNLEYSIRTGASAFEQVHQQAPWEFFQQHPQYGKPFNEWMTMLSTMGAEALIRHYDFSTARTICDIGGGQGYLLQAILAQYPQAKGILFDLPFVVKDAALGEVANRCEVVGGSFFQAVPTADVLILKSILHDWDDDSATNILKTCRAALETGGKILAMDMVIMEGGNPISFFYDLHMMVMLGGRERTQEEFLKLFSAAGLKITRFIPTGSPQFIIEAERD